jgi:hypothetical protein
MSGFAVSFLIQTVAGILGAHGAAVAAHEHRFGFLGHTLVGAIAGALGGFFLQSLAVTMVTASGSMNEPTPVENAVIQALTGLVVGGCAMLAVGLVRKLIEEHKAGLR